MASVHKKKNAAGNLAGPWIASYTDADKKRRTKNLPATIMSKKEAQRLADDLEREHIDRRKKGIVGEITVADAFELYIKTLSTGKRPRSPRHIASVRSKFRRLTGTVWKIDKKCHETSTVFVNPNMYVSKITKGMFTAFREDCEKRELGTDLQYKTQVILRKIIETAEDHDFAVPLKAIRFDRFEHDGYVPPRIGWNEMDDLVVYLRNRKPRANAILMLWYINTGARASEPFNARLKTDDPNHPSDIDIPNRRIFLRRKKGNPDSWWKITQSFADELDAYIATLPPDQVYVFESPRFRGRPRCAETQWYRDATAACGINSSVNVARRGTVTLHTVRHHVITSWIEAGVNREQVSKLIGHANARVTATYDHSSGEQFQNDVVAIQERRETPSFGRQCDSERVSCVD